MNLTELRVAGILGFVVVGLVTTIGAVVVSLLVAGAVRAGLAVGGWLTDMRARASEVEGRGAEVSTTRAVDASFRLDAADHALLARQAWWRLRC